MPELPEVEVTRISIAHRLVGASVQSAWVGKPLRWPLNCSPNSLVNQTIEGVDRRGKYLIFRLSQGVLLVHLGMSGSLVLAVDPAPRSTHDHFELMTNVGTLRLHDPRRFGAVVFVDSLADAAARKLLGHLGAEPLSPNFVSQAFVDAVHKKRAAIKQVLLDGAVVVGVGNIYASETLFVAGIRPSALAHQIDDRRLNRLHAAIQAVLSRAVELGGSTLKDFSNAQGEHGHFQSEAMVYGREGVPCRQCGIPIERIVQAQRSSYFCPQCQAL